MTAVAAMPMTATKPISLCGSTNCHKRRYTSRTLGLSFVLTALLRFRIVERRNADAGEPQPASDVHCGDDVLVLRICIGADGQRQVAVAARHFLQRISNRLNAAVNEFTAVDEERPGLGDHDIDLVRHLFDNFGAVGLRQADRYL